MEKTSRLNSILAQIKKLDHEGRLYLMEQLAKQLRGSKKKTSSRKTKLSELNGLGAEIWRGINPDEYVHQQREWD